MKKNYTRNSLRKLFKKKSNQAIMLFALLSASPIEVLSQQSYTFTNCSATGQNGPTQLQVNNAYLTTNLNGAVTISTLGIQMWTVPATGAYRIETYGAQGGVSWGLGAKMVGEFNLTAGQVLKIVVGQAGGSADNSHGTGGGGSFVIDNLNNPLIVAGGGGGRGATAGNSPAALCHGSIGTAGQSPTGGGPGGTGGGGGAAASALTGGTQTTPGQGTSSTVWCSGGGGFYTNGGQYNGLALNGGRSFFNNALGGDAGSGANVGGGFGGGGGAGDRGAGGGGFSGGGGATNDSEGGGGGGSFNSGINQVNVAGFNSGNGYVIITTLCNVTINGSTSICAGGSTTLSSTAVSNYSWSTGSTQSSIIVSPSTTTSYTVSGVGSINNCQSSIIVTVKVNPLPVITGVVQPSLLCVGSTATLTAFGANTYTWSAGPVSNTRSVSPLVSTNYNVVGTSTAGCVSSGVLAVNVNTLNVAATPTTICLGQNANLTATGGTSYYWLQGIPFQSISVSPSVATVYTVSGVDINNCTTFTTVSVGVNPLPPVTLSASKADVCVGEAVTLNAGGATTYSWSANNTSTGASIVVTPTIDLPTSYTVTGSDNIGCSKSVKVTITVNRCTGISELNSSADQISVYPNPSNGLFTVNSDLVLTVTISNELGQAVKTITLAEGKNEINVSGLSNGIYFMTGENNGVKINKKISIAK